MTFQLTPAQRLANAYVAALTFSRQNDSYNLAEQRRLQTNSERLRELDREDRAGEERAA